MKFKIFYGWYIVLAGLALLTYNGLIFGYGWSAFLDPVAATFGWTMAQLSLASSLRSLETGVFNPFLGPIVDRFPPRRLMFFGIFFTIAGTLLLSFTRNLPMYYAGFLITGIGSSLATGILPQTIIARWFKRDIGKANGLFYIGGAVSGVAIPLMVIIIDKFSWQNTLLFSAIGWLIIGIPLTMVFRSRPQDYGLLPDGRNDASPDAFKNRRAAKSTDFGTGIKAALRMRAFWHICVLTLFQNAGMSTMMLYAIPYLTSMGMNRQSAGQVVMIYTLISAATRIPTGMLADVFKKSYVMAISVVLMASGVLVFWLLTGHSPFWMILVFALLYGLGINGVNVLRAPLLQEYFGTRNFGAIFGFSSMFMTLASIVSQPLAGWVYDKYHDYKIWWLTLAIFAIVALVSILTIPKPRPQEAASAQSTT